jgi:hypothetical protein
MGADPALLVWCKSLLSILKYVSMQSGVQYAGSFDWQLIWEVGTTFGCFGQLREIAVRGISHYGHRVERTLNKLPLKG